MTTATLNQNTNVALDDLFGRIMGLKREDYAAPVRRLSAVQHDAEGDVLIRAKGNGEARGKSFRVTDYALGQLADRLSKGLRSYGEAMRERGFLGQYLRTVNETALLAPEAQKLQLRTIQPNGSRIVRGVVSDAYKPIDDDMIVPDILNLLEPHSGEWRSLGGQISETNTRIRFIQREPVLRDFGPNNRTIFAGFQYRNSEVAAGSSCFEAFFFDSFCENGCIFGKKDLVQMRFQHRGTRIKTAFGLVSEERVQQAEQAAIRGLIHDATANIMQHDELRKVARRVEEAARRDFDGAKDAVTAVESVGERAGLTKVERKHLLGEWMSNEPNAFGVANAITALAQKAPTYDARVRLEEAGGRVMTMDDRQWRAAMALAG